MGEDNARISDSEPQLRAINLAGFWMEASLYGLYLGLFAVAFNGLFRRKSPEGACRVHLTGIMLMFALISIHYGINAYRITVAFTSQTLTQEPSFGLYDMTCWANLSSILIEAMLLWTADVLAIYRCFLIWKRNYWIILLPLVLFLFSVATHMNALWLVTQYHHIHRIPVRASPILSLIFPLCLAQNLVTTFLVVYKIWAQHMRSRAAGLVSLHGPRLFCVIRIIIESAAIYTSLLLILVVLRALDHPGRFLVHSMVPPSTGIMFILLSIRGQNLREAKLSFASPSLMPSCLFDGDHTPQFETPPIPQRF